MSEVPFPWSVVLLKFGNLDADQSKKLSDAEALLSDAFLPIACRMPARGEVTRDWKVTAHPRGWRQLPEGKIKLDADEPWPPPTKDGNARLSHLNLIISGLMAEQALQVNGAMALLAQIGVKVNRYSPPSREGYAWKLTADQVHLAIEAVPT